MVYWRWRSGGTPAYSPCRPLNLDAAVAAAYGWLADVSDEQILERMLALNLERAAEEAKAQKARKGQAAQRAKAEQEMT